VDPGRQAEWTRKLRPIHLGAEPVDAQLGQRLGAVGIASVLFSGLMIFFLAIFAGFGRWEIGLMLDGLIAPALGWIWWGYFRLRRSVASYRRELAEDSGPG